MKHRFPNPHHATATNFFSDEYRELNTEFDSICEDYELKPNMPNRATLQGCICERYSNGYLDLETAEAGLQRITAWGIATIRLFERVNVKVYSKKVA